MEQSQNRIWFLIARSLSNEATVEEIKELLELLNGNIALQQQYDLIKRMWGTNSYDGDEKINEDEKAGISRILQLAAAENIHNAPGSSPGITTGGKIRNIQKRIYYLTGVAAVLIISLGVWISFSKQPAPVQAEVIHTPQSIATQNGTRTRTILPDGSTVWLNAGSRISYINDFNGKTREIKLEGEAYFDITKEPQRPFIVHVSGYDIKVLGTAFNVKSYPEDKTVETTLLRGLVQLTKEGDSKIPPIYIHPNQKVIVKKDDAGDSKNTAVSPQSSVKSYLVVNLDSVKENKVAETAWVYNRLEFRGETFETLARQLERWYNVTIVFGDEKVKQLTFSGSFETETVEQAFVALKAASPFNYIIKGQEIYISSIAGN